ncbi:MAG: biotin/lipoyl-containing protein, partial [Sulfuritalea sp.]|nr:biotin/lipoyl-containing protein [Sulfuritalea sp.]
VTEMVTGLDLVEWQLRVAAGEPLPLAQDEIVFSGHAIEARLYAEDPYANFAPQTGSVLHFQPDDALRPGVRIDSGIAEGGMVTPFYDPLLAKVIAHGRDRADAIRRLMAALEDAPLLGLPNNGRMLRDLVDHESFRAAQMHTTLLDEWATDGADILQRPQPSEADWQLAAAIFAREAGWRANSVAGFDLALMCGDKTRNTRVGAGETAAHTHLHANENGRLRYTQDGITRHAIIHRNGDMLHLARDATVFIFREASPFPVNETRPDPTIARAAVAGTVARLDVGAGDTVIAGQTLAVIEAMKMEMRVTANATGTVAAVRVLIGQQVEAGAILMELSIEEMPCLPTTKPF